MTWSSGGLLWAQKQTFRFYEKWGSPDKLNGLWLFDSNFAAYICILNFTIGLKNFRFSALLAALLYFLNNELLNAYGWKRG